MKKVILTLCTGIIMSGAAYSLYNAANDYGLATVSLPPPIVAQEDDTNGGDNTNLGPCDGLHVYCRKMLAYDFMKSDVTSNSKKEIIVMEKTFGGYKANTEYTAFFLYKHCVDDREPNVCAKDEQGVTLITVSEGFDTNGDSTNGNGSN